VQKVEWIPVLIYGPVRDVIRTWPPEVKKELGSVLTRLQKGESIGMPDVRPMAVIGAGASEIRIADRSEHY
jgi:phage-related protein